MTIFAILGFNIEVITCVGKIFLYTINYIKAVCQDYDDVVLCHTLPVFTGLGWCPIINWDFAGAVSIFGLDALPVIHQ